VGILTFDEFVNLETGGYFSRRFHQQETVMTGSRRSIGEHPKGSGLALPLYCYCGFGITIRHYSTTGNPHFNSESKTIDLCLKVRLLAIGL